MDVLKKIFPMAFKFTGETGQFVLGIIIHVAIWLLTPAIVSPIAVLIALIPVVGWIIGPVLGLIGGIASLYGLAGLVLCILVQTKVIKE